MDQLKDDGYLYSFRFHTGNCSNPNMDQVVYAPTIELMELFLIQHDFRVENCEIIPVVADDVNQDYVLEPYKFKSNYSNELFTIITCDRFVTDAIRCVANDLSNSLYFGFIAVRNDIEFIKIINELVSKLPHACVLDEIIYEEGKNMCIADYFNRFKERDEYDTWAEAQDDYFIGESLFSVSNEDGVLVITVEAYVTYFTELLTDEFNHY